jgi:hypothetical protein
MKGIRISLSLLLALAAAVPAVAQGTASDPWAATDALGRKVRSYDEAPARRDGKFVAIFYWTWHDEKRHNDDWQVKNITEIVRQYPEAMSDIDHPVWVKSEKTGQYYYWEQPLLGYYLTTDKWVLRKHAEMLADAGVDAVFFDAMQLKTRAESSGGRLLVTPLETRYIYGVAVDKRRPDVLAAANAVIAEGRAK